MKQVAQRPRDGRISVEDVPEPALRPGRVLVANRYSLISAGTERSKVELGEKSLLQKARARPDLVRKVVDRARGEGFRTAFATVRDRLDALAALGYSSAGIVLEVGEGVERLVPGDRVACAGGGWANHAEIVAVPRTLVAKVPEGVELADAAYGTVGAIALHGVRRAEAVVGERVGVIGLGLVGQLAVRILGAAGCRPIGIDLDTQAVELAAAGGARSFRRDDPALAAAVLDATDGLGLDAVLVCAASSSSDPVEVAARLARDRGRVVVVGDVPIEASRALFYEKELELRLSRSYGPGRYDRDYEEHGRDLPAGYVRWTEQRNIGAFLELVAGGGVRPAELTTHRIPIEQAADAYALLTAEPSEPRAFGILIEYADGERSARVRPAPVRRGAVRRERPRIALVGAGNFARSTLLPGLAAAGVELQAVATEGGLSAADAAARFGFARAATPQEVVVAEDVDAVVIATRHSSHAELVIQALAAGKAVFVEKPLALREEELAAVEAALEPGALLMVGFNRRFAPLTQRLLDALPGTGGHVLCARVNAGSLPADHWLHDPEEGGGRLLGEGCHFVDLLLHLGGSRAASAHAVAVPQPHRPLECSDAIAATLRLENGTVASLTYAGGGDGRLPKERIEAFGGGLAAVLDDFRSLELYRGGRRKQVQGAQDKGHRAQLACFVEAAAGRVEPPSVDTYLHATSVTLALAESLRIGAPVEPR